MEKGLEETKSPETEGGTPTSEEKGEESTQPSDESTVGRSYTEEEFRRELDKALGKGLESTNKQLSKHRQEAKASQAKNEEHEATIAALNAELEDLRKEQEELASSQFENDPEARQAYVNRRNIAEERRKLAREKAETERKLYQAEKLVFQSGLEKKADQLVKETGIDRGDLEDCNTEDEMEVKALRHQVKMATQQKPSGSKEPEKSEFDSDASSDSGGMPEHPTPEQLEKISLEQFAKWAERRYK